MLVKESVNVIDDIDLQIQQGEFVMLFGKVGSGKSALLQGLMNNMYKTNGTVSIKGSVSYVEPEPIIISGSIKDNILFGKEFDQGLYEKVI